MSDFRPFRAIYYTGGSSQDASSRLAPPYDVLDQSDKQALLAQDAKNFVAIDLPHMPPKAAGPPQAYEAAAATLREWVSSGVMATHARDAFYVYHQRYQHAGASYTRKMFFARLKLEPFGSGSVFPHEQTFGGPKEDRLALTKATRANLSPIFGLYPDAENAVARRLESALADPPLLRGRLGEIENTVWAVSDAKTIEDVRSMLVTRPVFIADGHHRYGTSMLYREWLETRQGKLPADHPANFTLCASCAMEDDGLLILPTHRVLLGVDVSPELLRGDENLEPAHLLADSPEAAVQKLAQFGPLAVGVASGAREGYLVVRPRRADLLDSLEPKHSTAWRRLGVAFLHAYLLDRLVTPRLCGGKAPEIHYVKAAEPAVAEARTAHGTALLLQPTTMQELRDVCQAGDLMPQKSTFFYPKLASGLLVNPLEP